MRTVNENRYGLDRVFDQQNTVYKHLRRRAPRPKSCFYDFGERKQVRFVESVDDDKSEFIESLMEQFCN